MLNYVVRSPMTLWSAGLTGVVFLAVALLGQLFGPPPQLLLSIEMTVLVASMILSVLGIYFDIAPPFITRLEVDWANRNAAFLYKEPVTFDEEEFLRPILNRVVAFSGGHRNRISSHELRLMRV